MPALKNTRQECFAQLVASGTCSDVAAYRRAYKSTQPTAEANASRLREYAPVKARIDQLQAEISSKLTLTREQLAAFLVECILTPAGRITSSHRLCQSVKPTEHGTEIQIPNKLGAAAQLSKLLGWDAAERVDLSINPLATIFADIRARRGPKTLRDAGEP